MIWTVAVMYLYAMVIRNIVAAMAYTHIISGDRREDALDLIE